MFKYICNLNLLNFNINKGTEMYRQVFGSYSNISEIPYVHGNENRYIIYNT